MNKTTRVCIEPYRLLRSRTAGRAEPCIRRADSTVLGLSSYLPPLDSRHGDQRIIVHYLCKVMLIAIHRRVPDKILLIRWEQDWAGVYYVIDAPFLASHSQQH